MKTLPFRSTKQLHSLCVREVQAGTRALTIAMALNNEAKRWMIICLGAQELERRYPSLRLGKKSKRKVKADD